MWARVARQPVLLVLGLPLMLLLVVSVLRDSAGEDQGRAGRSIDRVSDSAGEEPDTVRAPPPAVHSRCHFRVPALNRCLSSGWSRHGPLHTQCTKPGVQWTHLPV
jgi:hypothetical protein